MIHLHVVLWCCFTIGLFLEIFLLAQVAASISPGPVIMTMVGSFQGIQVTPPGMTQSVFAFLGIPYAKPPIGPQRFSKPVPIGFLEDLYSATTKPPSCFQLESDLHLPWADTNSSMNEDCLYLNIWTPTGGMGDLMPVMVWIHGGGFTSGSSAMDLYDGQILSILGRVVVVTFNYRLGPFGFLDALTDDIPGNAGLYDQILALKWVQNSIQFFGGDPKRVTLFGESAGAVSTGLLALSPLSRGLFHRLILQSGSSYVPPGMSPSSSVKNGNRLATLVECANDTFTLFTNPKEVVSCLRNVPATELVKTYYEQNGSQLEKIAIFFFPQFWDEVIPRHPIDIYRSQNFTAYDTFIGLTQMEGSSLLLFFFPDVYQQIADGNFAINETLFAAALSGLLEEYGISQPQEAVDFYFKDVEDDEESVLTAISNAISDPGISCPTVYFAERYAAKGAPVFFYRFDHSPTTSPFPKSMGATHFEEVQFVFGLPMRYPERYQDEEKVLSEYMIRTWTNFAKSENPTLKSGSRWPNYSRSKPDFATFQTGQQAAGTGIRKEACEMWRPYFEGP